MSSDKMVDQDAATQQMVKDAAINFPDKPQDEAMQAQADMGPGREAWKHEGAVSSAMESAKETARGVKEAAAGAGVGAGAGDEASRATGGGGGGILDSVKDAAASSMDTLKQANPATRDMKEEHC